MIQGWLGLAGTLAFPGDIRVLLALAAGVLAWAGVLLSPAIGALLMSVSTVVVAFNARLLRMPGD
jgi:cation transport ATPase